MNPSQIEQLVRQGLAFQQSGQLAQAAASFARLRQLAPRCVDGWQLGGNVALLLENAAEAATLYRQASRLAPRSGVVAMCLGVAEMARGNLEAAESHLRVATRLEPKNADVFSQLALLLRQQGRNAEALQCHHRAVELAPKSAPAWHGYATTLSFLSRSVDALECERRALTLDPDYLAARHGHAIALQKCHRIPEAVAEFDRILVRNPRLLDVQSHRLLSLHYLHTVSSAELFEAHRRYGQLAEAGVSWPRFSNTPDPDRRLRIAFFSADFRRHAVANFILPLLQHLKREEFEILLYSFTTEPDATTQQFRALASTWRDVSSQLKPAALALGRSDSIDIAVDLGGHTGSGHLELFAHGLAPVQITYLGYPNTTGLHAMHYRLVDATTDPPDVADALHTEKLVRFAPTAWAYAPPHDAPEPAPAPSLEHGSVTFGSFNNFSKVTDEMLRLWGQLLSLVPASRLFLKSIELSTPAITAHVRSRLQTAGLPTDRVELAGVTSTIAEHLAAYSRIDVALDTAPYNGTTTTCEALWMGVPVVTLRGDRHAGRVGASLLQAAGHPEWIAQTPSDYVRIAASLAIDPHRLATARGSLRREMLHSPLLDHPAQAARFGAALRGCWRNWCQQHASDAT